MRRPAFWDTYRGLDRSVYVLFLAQVVNSVGHFVHPFLTLFLTQKLGLDPVRAGFYVFLSSLAWAPGSLLGGKIADHFGRKRTMTLFQSLAGACLVPCAFLGTSGVVPWLLILAAFFNGAADPVGDAMIADVTSAERRRAAYSLLYLGHNIGFALGPTIAGFLFNRYLPWFFLGDAFTTGAAVLLILLFVRETAPGAEEIARSLAAEPSLERAEEGSLVRALWRRPLLLAFLAVQVLFSLVYSQTGFSLPLQMSAMFGAGGPERFGVLMSTNALVVIFLTTLVVHRTQRLAPLLSIALAGLFFAAGLGAIGFLRAMPWLIATTVVWTVGEILHATNVSAYVANHAPMSHRGRFNALAPIVMGSGYALGPPLAGAFIERFSVDGIWPLALVLSLAGSGLTLLLFRVQRRQQREHPLQRVDIENTI